METVKKQIERLLIAGGDKITKWLELEGYYEAPASAAHHNSFKGGLCVHSLSVYHCLQTNFPLMNSEDLIVAGLLHDVCKCGLYKFNPKTGAYTKDPDIKGHGGRSVELLKPLIDLSTEQEAAIRWHMGLWDVRTAEERGALVKAIDTYPLLRALMVADQYVSYFVDKQGL